MKGTKTQRTSKELKAWEKEKKLIGVVTIFGSFGPVLAVSALRGNLTQTFASGDRVLNLLEEKPAVTPIKNGKTLQCRRPLRPSNRNQAKEGCCQVQQPSFLCRHSIALVCRCVAMSMRWYAKR